jgi:hypothetical protein
MTHRDDTALPASAAAMLTPWTQPTTGPRRLARRHASEIQTTRRAGYVRS